MSELVFVAALPLIISSAYYWLLNVDTGRALYPDSHRYFAAGGGERLHKPFHLRWLLPFVCRQSPRLWKWVTGGAMVLLPVMMSVYLYEQGVEPKKCLVGACLLLGLPGIIRMNALAEYLLDGTALLFMLTSATCFLAGNVPLGIAFSCLGGMTKESTPIFAALACWNPLALLGFVPVIAAALIRKPNPVDMLGGEVILSHPFQTGIQFHRGRWFSLEFMLLPFGVCILGLMHLSVPLIVMIVVSYAQLLVATDSVRLYQWCFPLLILATVQVLPLEYSAIAIVMHWLNPYQKYYI